MYILLPFCQLSANLPSLHSPISPQSRKAGSIYVHVRSPSVLLWFKICLELEETDLGCDVGGAMRTLDRVAWDDGFVHASFQPIVKHPGVEQITDV